jgi:Zn-dependent protease with chaperone function
LSYVFEILFALAALALPELGWTGVGVHPWGVAALVVVPYALGWCTRRVLLAGRFRLGAVLERVLWISPVLLHAVAIGELGWLTFLERRDVELSTLDGWLGVELLHALAPYLAYQLAAIDARARNLVFPPDSAGRLRAFQLRLFLSAFLPFLAYLAGSSLLARSATWQVRFEEVGLLGGFLAVLLVAVFLRGMPFFLRYAWDTAPLERGWARTMLEQVARSAGFRYRELLVWRTGQQMSNAAIVGLTERSRMVFFSDLLLQQLGPRELAAVFAHEMGHARRAHTATFGAFALGFFLLAHQLMEGLEIGEPLWEGALFVALLALWYLSFGYLSRRFELEADLESLRVVGESAPLIHALELVTGAHAHKRSSWRHFSTRDRVAFLRAAETDPLVGARLRLKLARWRTLGFAILAVAALVHVWGQARSWNQDWLVADLRLGRFEEAARRADSSGVDEEVASLARRAVSSPKKSREPKALCGNALSAWMRDDHEAALEWLKLAQMRGGRNLEPLIDALEVGGEGIEGLPMPWREALRMLSER